MIVLYQEKKNCCGCTACMNVCKKKAITMKKDTEGFNYPVVNESVCLDCGMCKGICDFQNTITPVPDFNEPLVYAVKHKKDSVRMTSSSGGAFTAISDYILKKQGVVYGVSFDDDMTVVHKRALTTVDRDRFKGSKYVQSDLSDIFQLVELDLINGLLVLFTGTPCQCAGLKRYLDTKRIFQDKLVLCDIVCHGTSSPKIWHEHINSLAKRENSTVKAYDFRSKIYGWRNHTEKVVYENGKNDYKSMLSQMHKKIYNSRNAHRPACHHCIYTSFLRYSDITIADFWNIEKTIPDFYDDKGASLVLVNTIKGVEVFNQIKEMILYLLSSANDCVQPQLIKPTEASNDRDRFWNDYYSKGYNYIIKEYFNYGFFRQIKVKIKKTAKDVLLKVDTQKKLKN